MAEGTETSGRRLPVPPTVQDDDEGAREVLSVWARTECRSFVFDAMAIHPQQWGEVLANVVESISMAALPAGASVEGRLATRQEVRNSIITSLDHELRALDDAARKKQGN